MARTVAPGKGIRKDELAKSKRNWKGDNYGGPPFPCRLCGHWPIHVVKIDPTDEETEHKCIVMRDSGEARIVTEESRCCRYFQLQSYYWCKDVSQMVHHEACAYRYYNNLMPECEDCPKGKMFLKYLNEFELKEIPSREEIWKRMCEDRPDDRWGDAFGEEKP